MFGIRKQKRKSEAASQSKRQKTDAENEDISENRSPCKTSPAGTSRYLQPTPKRIDPEEYGQEQLDGVSTLGLVKSSPDSKKPEHDSPSSVNSGPIVVDINEFGSANNDQSREGSPPLFSAGDEEEEMITPVKKVCEGGNGANKRLTGARKRKSGLNRQKRSINNDEKCWINDDETAGMDGFVSMEEKVAVSAVTDQSAVADQSTSTCKGTINQEPVHLIDNVPEVVKSLGERAVKAYKCNWLASPPGVNSNCYSKVVELMLDEYREKLKVVQKRMLTDAAAWGNEIDEGETDGRTLDKKRAHSRSINERLGSKNVPRSADTSYMSTTCNTFISSFSRSLSSVSSLSNRTATSTSSSASAAATVSGDYNRRMIPLTHSRAEEGNDFQGAATLRKAFSDTSTLRSRGDLQHSAHRFQYSPRREARPLSSTSTKKTNQRESAQSSNDLYCFQSSEGSQTDSVDDDTDGDLVPSSRRRKRRLIDNGRQGVPTKEEGGNVTLNRENNDFVEKEEKKGLLTLKRKQLRPGGVVLKRVGRLNVSREEEEKRDSTSVADSNRSSDGWISTREQSRTSHSKILSREETQQNCPICNKRFDKTVIERHAAQCGEDEDEREERSPPKCRVDVIEVTDDVTSGDRSKDGNARATSRASCSRETGRHMDNFAEGTDRGKLRSNRQW